MKAASLHLLKQELKQRSSEEVLQICLRLARYKAENKELLTYLLLEADDEESYIRHIRYAIDEQLEAINRTNVYYTKKGLRKVERYLNKWIRYSGLKATEVELRLYFAQQLIELKFPIERSKVLINLYNRQLDKVSKTMAKLHEDLQYDYQLELEELPVIRV